jgi:acylphosphatase
MRINLAHTLLLALSLTLAAPTGMSKASQHIPNSPTRMVNQRIHVFFSGNVQGVGFRQTVRSYAIDLGLVGWVKNLPDARVEMVAEGPENDLNYLLGKVCSEFEVDKAEVKKERPEGNFKGFEIVK